MTALQRAFQRVMKAAAEHNGERGRIGEIF
jgi:hypothetical protein